ncbi:hypothetical protein KCU81_g7661, partial [Aureobasidium melanogenum]|uniref:MARVEL domain-containing protein n=1 Tax=Aureobasidium melanogenum (strain CBS 110374) TaxID=1043003 RepID=A0A074WCC0_AURM1
MALSGFLFLSFRIAQLLTLIPIVGMLAWFVHGFVVNNQLTPTYILLLFITSVLAAAWTLATLVTYLRARHSALFVALVDLAFVGTLIAAVYELRAITNQDCAHFSSGSIYLSLGPFGYYGRESGSQWALHINKTCAMLKACFALAIINIIFFFITFLLALLVHRHHRERDTVVIKKEYHSTRHGQRRSSRGSYDRRNSPRRSHHSSSRRYYV